MPKKEFIQIGSGSSSYGNVIATVGGGRMLDATNTYFTRIQLACKLKFAPLITSVDQLTCLLYNK